jgi:cytochrome P450
MAQSGHAHARLRRLVSAAFTPRQVERLRPRLREYLSGLWQDIAPAGRCDVVTALARPLPSMDSRAPRRPRGCRVACPLVGQSQLAHGLRLFADHPDQWDRLANEPALAEQACQEVLRFEPIAPFTARLVRAELELESIVFPVGTVLFICAATANRDPVTYAEPGSCDIMADRAGAQVLSCGFGEHFCAGAHLARAEIIEALAPRLCRLRAPNCWRPHDSRART